MPGIETGYFPEAFFTSENPFVLPSHKWYDFWSARELSLGVNAEGNLQITSTPSFWESLQRSLRFLPSDENLERARQSLKKLENSLSRQENDRYLFKENLRQHSFEQRICFFQNLDRLALKFKEAQKHSFLYGLVLKVINFYSFYKQKCSNSKQNLNLETLFWSFYFFDPSPPSLNPDVFAKAYLKISEKERSEHGFEYEIREKIKETDDYFNFSQPASGSIDLKADALIEVRNGITRKTLFTVDGECFAIRLKELPGEKRQELTLSYIPPSDPSATKKNLSIEVSDEHSGDLSSFDAREISAMELTPGNTFTIVGETQTISIKIRKKERFRFFDSLNRLSMTFEEADKFVSLQESLLKNVNLYKTHIDNDPSNLSLSSMNVRATRKASDKILEKERKEPGVAGTEDYFDFPTPTTESKSPVVIEPITASNGSKEVIFFVLNGKYFFFDSPELTEGEKQELILSDMSTRASSVTEKNLAGPMIPETVHLITATHGSKEAAFFFLNDQCFFIDSGELTDQEKREVVLANIPADDCLGN